jgi:hypothetical protein
MNGEIITIIKAVNNMIVKTLAFLQEFKMKYQISPINDALKTGAVSQTKSVKTTITKVIQIILKKTGKNLNIKLKNIINIVILKPETAIK